MSLLYPLKLIQTLMYAFLLNCQSSIPMAKCSWYGPGFHGKQTASGLIYDQEELTCAHMSLPLGTEILTWNPETNVIVIGTITDRGDFAGLVDFDLSRGWFDVSTRGDLDRGHVMLYYIPIGFSTEGLPYPNN